MMLKLADVELFRIGLSSTLKNRRGCCSREACDIVYEDWKMCSQSLTSLKEKRYACEVFDFVNRHAKIRGANGPHFEARFQSELEPDMK